MKTLFEKIGGRDAVNAAVENFYTRVLADERINGFFKDIDMKSQRKKQILFLTYAFGGPNNYSGQNMRDGHAKFVAQGLNDEHFNAVVENLAATLTELNVPAELIQEVANIAETTRADILGR
ncbi:group 1 truncated hemoglobin [Halobacteriovorax marinus]|uniref:Group 1 truncated hemoglobin n=1 Tax=Halobacteriovorax marinus TaxID=97084 RepID=A0A1Y5F246_9BACT|nr:group 1 truncated hemoglobin [Halobacteriovorax marinus]